MHDDHQTLAAMKKSSISTTCLNKQNVCSTATSCLMVTKNYKTKNLEKFPFIVCLLKFLDVLILMLNAKSNSKLKFIRLSQAFKMKFLKKLVFLK